MHGFTKIDVPPLNQKIELLTQKVSKSVGLKWIHLTLYKSITYFTYRGKRMSDKDKDYDIEIEDELKHCREGRNKAGEIFKTYYQTGSLNIGRKNDIEFNVPLAESQPPFRRGLYRFKGRNTLFGTSEYGNLQIKKEYQYGSEMFPIELIEEEKKGGLVDLKNMGKTTENFANTNNKQEQVSNVTKVA